MTSTAAPVRGTESTATRYCDELTCPSVATVELTIGPRPYVYVDSCDLHTRDLVHAGEQLIHETPIQQPATTAAAATELDILTGTINARRIDAGSITADSVIVPGTCDRAPAGWWCNLELDHDGPCPARPDSARPLTIARVPVPAEYRPSKWSSPWSLLLGLFGYELWAVATGKPGGPLSHLVWWSYGPRWSLRWWLASMGMNGFGVWAAAHFMFERWEVRELGYCVAVGLLLGAVGWAVTR